MTCTPEWSRADPGSHGTLRSTCASCLLMNQTQHGVQFHFPEGKAEVVSAIVSLLIPNTLDTQLYTAQGFVVGTEGRSSHASNPLDSSRCANKPISMYLYA